MKRKERTQVLVEGDRDLLGSIAREVERTHDVEVVREPVEELVMLKMRESARRSQFYLGEALMTSCVVRIGEAYGYGMVLGEDRDKAFDLAIVDAAYTLSDPADDLSVHDERIAEEQERIAAQKRLRNEALLRTQVDFSTMEA